MKILIVGLGSIGKKHVKVIKSILPNSEIFALRSKIESEHFPGVTNIYSDNEVAKLPFDFAIISNPTSEHKKYISSLLKYNIPLFIEKPLYYSLDIKELVRIINKLGILTYVACNLRFLECILFIKEQMIKFKSKRLNEVNIYCGSYLPEWRPNVDYRTTCSANKELGGGVHIDLIHELDYLYWLFGKPKDVSKKFTSQSSLSISAFDYANFLLEYEGFSVSVVLNYYRMDQKRNMEMVFNDETWNVDLLKNQVTCNDRILFKSDQTISDTYLSQMEYFLDCVNTRGESFNTVNDAFEVLNICLE